MSYNKEIVNRLIETGYQNTVRMLEDYGNVLNDKHKEALWHIHREYAHITMAKERKRVAFGLSTGAGKTASVVGHIRALEQLGLSFSVLVCQETIDSLCDLKDWLVREGVNPDKVGILHHKPYDPERAAQGDSRYAREPSIREDNTPHYQHLLIAHNKIKGEKFSLAKHYTCGGKKRSLCIWDESLMVTEAEGLEKARCRGAIMEALTLYEERKNEGRTSSERVDALYTYLSECDRVIQEAFKQEHEGEYSVEIVFPPLPRPLDDMEEAVKPLLGNSRENLERIKHLLRFTTGKCRAVNAKGHSIIKYQVVVPDAVDNVVILDASSPIRKLAQLDQSITHRDELDIIKDYSPVTFHYWKGGAGRESVQEDIKNGSDSLVFNEFLSLVEKIPENEPILIFTFKKRGENGLDIISDFKLKLQGHGIDRENIYFETFGRETGSNRYAHCKHVFFMGVLHLPNEAIAAQASGQARLEGLDRETITTDLLTDIQYSEQAHRIYQGASRGNSRTTDNGKAGEQHIYLFHSRIDRVRSYLEIVMPGAQWERYDCKYMDNSLNMQEALAQEIASNLSLVEGDKISSSAMKKRFFSNHEIASRDKNLWTRAFKLAPKWHCHWEIEGRSLVRNYSS